jgi:His-Xaa-Ser system protein HxsD
MKKEILLLNPKVYPVDVIYAAAYVMLEKAYFLLDEQNGRIKVEIEPKDGKTDYSGDFRTQLINYGFYKKQLEKASKIKELMLQEVFSQFTYDDYVKDPQGIMIPWEEKYGPKAKQKALPKKRS